MTSVYGFLLLLAGRVGEEGEAGAGRGGRRVGQMVSYEDISNFNL